MKATHLLINVAMLLTSKLSFGFALLEGEVKAKLDVTPENPTVIFEWDGKFPKIKKTSTVLDKTSINQNDLEAVMEEGLKRAMQLWNEVPGAYIKLELNKQSGASINSDDNIHTISVDNSKNQSIIAFAQPKIEDGFIVDCDITVTNRSIEAKTLFFALAHELGHCLGLGHEHSNYEALMGYSRTGSNLSLGGDDEAGVIYLYPDPAYSTSERTTLDCASTVAASTKVPPGTIWLFYFILGIPLALQSSWQSIRIGARNQT